MTATQPHRVVVVGGGFGGLPATRLLAAAGLDVTLIDRRNHHLFQPLLYQVATGILSPGSISPVLRHIFRKRKNVTVVLSTVTGFDLERRVVHTAALPGEINEFRYDSLIVAAGAGQSYFGHDEFAMIAPGMKTIDDAMELRRRVYGSLELAENLADLALQRFWMTFVIVGAGPTGVELAGQIRELASRSLVKDFRHIQPGSVRVIMIDGGTEPLANFGGHLSGRARTELEKMGVELRMGLRVVGVDPLGVDTESATGEKGRYECGTVIWAAGVQASPLAGLLAEATGAETDRSGRIAVLPDLSLPGHPEVFALGDMASIDDLPGVCEVAMQGGLHAANTIKRRLKGADSVPFRYRDLGSAAAIGRFKAMVSVGPLRLSGFPGFLVWMFVHLAFLNGFGHRFTALWRWGRAMVGRARPERVFSVGHTGGDLSLPDEVKARVMPKPFPILEDNVGWTDLVARIGTPAPRGDGPGAAEGPVSP
ncbi:MAG: NAD(P)/FAD-dependent oxidoreductase [Acidimicrobiales bacterium]